MCKMTLSTLLKILGIAPVSAQMGQSPKKAGTLATCSKHCWCTSHLVHPASDMSWHFLSGAMTLSVWFIWLTSWPKTKKRIYNALFISVMDPAWRTSSAPSTVGARDAPFLHSLAGNKMMTTFSTATTRRAIPFRWNVGEASTSQKPWISAQFV